MTNRKVGGTEGRRGDGLTGKLLECGTTVDDGVACVGGLESRSDGHEMSHRYRSVLDGLSKGR